MSRCLHDCTNLRSSVAAKCERESRWSPETGVNTTTGQEMSSSAVSGMVAGGQGPSKGASSVNTYSVCRLRGGANEAREAF